MFPMTQQAQDLMMAAPAAVPDDRLEELHIRVVLPPPKD
jgi:aspartyl-tRNA synthetase